jgi:hypothetical protein
LNATLFVCRFANVSGMVHVKSFESRYKYFKFVISHINAGISQLRSLYHNLRFVRFNPLQVDGIVPVNELDDR